MILTYTGTGEAVPQLGSRWVDSGDVLNVKNDRIARELLQTMRWKVYAPKIPRIFKVKEVPKIDIPIKIEPAEPIPPVPAKKESDKE